MGHIRFRRSFGLGRFFRLNLGKRGVSVTAGRNRGGPHFTVHSSGRTTTSVGLPGTGLSYVHTSRISRLARATRGKLYWIVGGALVIAFIVWSSL